MPVAAVSTTRCSWGRRACVRPLGVYIDGALVDRLLKDRPVLPTSRVERAGWAGQWSPVKRHRQITRHDSQTSAPV